MEDTSYSVDENGYEWTNWEGRDYWRIAGSGAEWNLYEISNPILSDEEPAIESTSFELKEIPSIHENKDSSFDSIKFNRKHIFSLFVTISLVLGSSWVFLSKESTQVVVEEPSTFELEENWMVYSVESWINLPVCNSAILGHLYYVELENTFMVCRSNDWDLIDVSGSDGSDGSNGSNGTDGVDGLNSLFTMQAEENGINCPNGGKKLSVGIDINSNNILDIAEISQTGYICDLTPSTSAGSEILSRIDSPPGKCRAGGHKLSHGYDNGEGDGTASNGILENGEIEYSVLYCNNYQPDIVYTVVSDYPNMLDIEMLGEANNRLFFFQPGNFGGEIYSTNFSTETPNLLLGNVANSAGVVLDSFFSMGDYFLFGIRSNGQEQLWKSDGTTTGTQLLKTFPDGGVYDGNIVSLQGVAYFRGGGTGLPELWSSDGTPEGTNMVVDVGGGITDLTSTGSALFFAVLESNDQGELWTSDGTASGTNIVIESSGYRTWMGIVPIGSRVVYDCGGPICVSDGTELGTDSTGVSHGFFSPWDEIKILQIGENVVFGTHGRAYIATTNLSAGNQLLDGCQIPHPTGFSEMNGKLVYLHNGLYEFDFVNCVSTYLGSGPELNQERHFQYFDGHVFATSSVYGNSNYVDLWRFNLNTSEWDHIQLSKTDASPFPREFVEYNGELYFVARLVSPLETFSIWKANGKVVTEVIAT